jgi:hypothetical protein
MILANKIYYLEVYLFLICILTNTVTNEADKYDKYEVCSITNANGPIKQKL